MTTRKSEIIVSSCGTYSKRVFKGQRWMVVGQMDEESPLIVTAFCTEAEAKRVSAKAGRDGYQVHFVTHAAPRAGGAK